MQIRLKNQSSQRPVISIRRSRISQIISDLLSEVRRTDLRSPLIYVLINLMHPRWIKVSRFFQKNTFLTPNINSSVHFHLCNNPCILLSKNMLFYSKIPNIASNLILMLYFMPGNDYQLTVYYCT